MAFIWNLFYAQRPGEGEPTALPDDAVTPIEDDGLHQTRVMTLSELMAGLVDVNAAEAEEDLARDVGLDVTWRAIFEAAGLETPEHGWTIERALAFLKAAEAKGMTPMQVALSLERALVDHGADVVRLAHEAVAKDEVLDLYEQKLEAAITGRHEASLVMEAGIERQIEQLRGRMEQLRAERESTARRFTAWQSEKRLIEQQWARVLQVLAPILAEREPRE